MKYSGIDLHSNNRVVTVTDEEDRMIAEKRLPNDLERIIGFLHPWRDELAGVVVESTCNWYWLVDGLQEAGFMVKLVNTGAIRKYDGLKHSGDEADAWQLAHLLRLGILPAGAILPAVNLHRYAPVLDLFFHFVCDIGSKLVHVVITLRADEFRQCVDQVPCLFDLRKTASAGQAFFAIVAAGGLAFAGVECAHSGLPSASKFITVISPSMSVISACFSLPLSRYS